MLYNTCYTSVLLEEGVGILECDARTLDGRGEVINNCVALSPETRIVKEVDLIPIYVCTNTNVQRSNLNFIDCVCKVLSTNKLEHYELRGQNNHFHCRMYHTLLLQYNTSHHCQD